MVDCREPDRTNPRPPIIVDPVIFNGLQASCAEFRLRVLGLTPTQRLVLSHLATGKLNKQIAHVCSMSEATVKTHVSHILRKLGSRSRTRAAVLFTLCWAMEDGEAE